MSIPRNLSQLADNYNPVTDELSVGTQISNNGIMQNASTVNTSYTIAAGNNGLSSGPISVATGVSVTVSTGATWTIV
jgi:hypothetical protein